MISFNTHIGFGNLFLFLFSKNIHLISTAGEANVCSYSPDLTGQSCLESFPNWAVNEEIGGAVEGQQEVAESHGDLQPEDTGDTATLGVVFVQLGLVEILGQVEEEPGDVADQVHEDYRSQGPGGVRQTAPVLSYLILA